MRVALRDNMLCAAMPALIALNAVFRPMWRLAGARVDGDEVCWRLPRGVSILVVRVGRGHEAEYYLVDVDAGTVERLRMRPTRKLGGGWMLCGKNTRRETICVELGPEGLTLRYNRLRWTPR